MNGTLAVVTSLHPGNCKIWTLDSGLDRGLDRGLDHGLDYGLTMTSS